MLIVLGSIERSRNWVSYGRDRNQKSRITVTEENVWTGKSKGPYIYIYIMFLVLA
jgi:hypothetical protein